MQKLIETLFSPNGMRIVNALFLLSLVFPRSGLGLLANLAWAAYLLFCVNYAEGKVSRIIYCIFLAIAVTLSGINLYSLLR